MIKDQVRWTPFVKQSPHIYFIYYKTMGSLTVRFAKAASTRAALQKVEAVIKKFDASAPFNYEFLDDDYAGMFKEEERIGTLATVFSSLAILISCIGIFGLASFATIQRAREIGIRKVLGASVFGLWKMLLKDFLLLVGMSLVNATSCDVLLATSVHASNEGGNKVCKLLRVTHSSTLQRD